MYDQSKLDSFATQPGVYLMKGRDDNILYVGKAKNLRQRVKQYFVPGRDGRIMVPYLVAKIESIDTIIVFSEKEALLLENNLIKQHKPRYNALLKDDKTYIALKVNNKHKWPTVSIIRYKGSPKPDGLYFGPYTSADSARQTLDLLQRIFPLRQCSDQELARRTRPCILYDMKRCIAPCVNRCTKEEYDAYVNRTIRFLRGQDREILKELYKEMHDAAESLEFEKAGDVQQTISFIERTLEGQIVDRPLGGVDADALAIFREGEEVILTQLIFRSGKLNGSRHFDFTAIAEEDKELLESFIMQHYEKQVDLPREILLPVLPDASDALSEILSKDRKRITLIAPQKGERKGFVDMAYVNAEARFRKEKDAKTIREKILMEMKEKFHLKNYPNRIECFDNSSISGTSIVSTLVAFTGGVKDSSRYRKYKIRTVTEGDDYAAMHESLERRYRRGKDENDLPDLLVVDGGKGHLNIALKVLADLDIVSIDVIGLAKEEGRHDKGATSEQVFLPNIKDPILLKRTSPLLFLLQQIRDEAHRTAITFHRKLRMKKTIKSALDEISGIGPVKRKLLLKHFGSVKKIIEAKEADLQAVPGLSSANIKILLAFISSKSE
ncbi:MAG TPA: excinuclease ABC subunit UvrC [Parachlamydiaceae bacterium]|nr:excinuclease ABC subunit UvrC [Parachlamydiaceae bacterium]